MCIIIIIIYTYNINSMPPPPKRNTKKRNTKKYTIARLPSNLRPLPLSPLPPPPPPPPAAGAGGGKLENPDKSTNPKKTGRGHKKTPEKKNKLAPRRKQTGQSKKKIGQPNNHYIQTQIPKPFEYENNKQTNNELITEQKNAINKGYNFAAIPPRVHVPSVAETGQPTQQDYNNVASNLQENLQQPALSSPQQGERSYLDNMNNAFGLGHQTPMRSNSGMDINSKYDNTLPPLFDGNLDDLDNLDNNSSSMSGGKRKKRTVKKKKVKKVNGKKITSGKKTQKKR